MNRKEIFSTWAPPGGRWSNWVKPVLFAHIGDDVRPAEPVMLELSAEAMFPRLRSDPGAAGHPYRSAGPTLAVAVVVDLPGAKGVAAGLALAQLGLRPVPLYNALPAPEWPARERTPLALGPVVDVWPIVQALGIGAMRLAALNPPADAPPAFLLDAERLGRRRRRDPQCSYFDNRSLSAPFDFPSAERLREAGIRRVVVLREECAAPQRDLIETLRAWQAGGLSLYLQGLKELGSEDRRAPVPWRISGVGLFNRLWTFLSMSSLHRHPGGGFGGTVLGVPRSAGG